MNDVAPITLRLRRAAASPWFILAAVMLVAAALRVPGLERFVESRIGTPCCTLGGDEAYTLRIAMQPLDTILGLPDGGNNWILYLFAHFWLQLIGAPTNVGLRIVPLALSLASLPAAYLALREMVRVIAPRTWLGAERVALIGTALLAVHPMHIFYATQFRTPSAVVLLAACTTYLAARMVGAAQRGAPPSMRAWLLLGVAHGAGIYLHMLSATYWVALVAMILSMAPLMRREVRLQLVRGAVVSGVAVAIVAARLLVAAAQVGTKQISWIGPLDPPQMATFATRYLGGGVLRADYLENLPAAIVVSLLVGGLVLLGRVAAARAIPRSDRRAQWGWFAPLLLAGVPPLLGCAISLAITPVLLPRYFISLLVPVALLFALAVDTLGGRVSAARRHRTTRALLLVAWLVAILIAMVAGYWSPPIES